MAEFDRQYPTAARSRAGAGVETLDQGLRAFMLGIYNNMAIGLALTGARRLRRLSAWRHVATTAVGAGALRQPAEVGDHAGAARLRVRPFGDGAPDAAGDGAARVPRLRGGDGPFDVVHLPRLHRAEHRADVLHHGRLVRRAEPLGLHDEAGHLRLGLVPVHGRDRHHHRDDREHLPRLAGAPVRDLGDRRADLRRASPPTTRSG